MVRGHAVRTYLAFIAVLILAFLAPRPPVAAADESYQLRLHAPTGLIANGRDTREVVVEVVDQQGAVITTSDLRVTLQTETGAARIKIPSGELVSQWSTRAVAGVARFSVVHVVDLQSGSGATPGVTNLTASADSLPSIMGSLASVAPEMGSLRLVPHRPVAAYEAGGTLPLRLQLLDTSGAEILPPQALNLTLQSSDPTAVLPSGGQVHWPAGGPAPTYLPIPLTGGPGTYTISGTGLAIPIEPVTITTAEAGPAAKLVFVGVPSVLTPPKNSVEIVAAVLDSNGVLKSKEPMPDIYINLARGRQGYGSMTQRANYGFATFNFSGLMAGTYTADARATNLERAFTTVTVNPGPVVRLGRLRVETNPPYFGTEYTLSADGAHTVTLAVDLQDWWGNPVDASLPVTFKPLTAPRAFTGLDPQGTTVTAQGGVARVAITATAVPTEIPDLIQVEAKLPDGTPLFGSLDTTVQMGVRSQPVGQPSQIQVTGLMPPYIVGDTIPVRVRVTDDQGAFVSTDNGRTVTLEVLHYEMPFLLLTAQTAGGEAIFNLAPTKQGGYRLRARTDFGGVMRQSEGWAHMEAGAPVSVEIRARLTTLETGSTVQNGIETISRDAYGNQFPPQDNLSGLVYTVNGSREVAPYLDGAGWMLNLYAGTVPQVLTIADADGKASVIWNGVFYPDLPVTPAAVVVKAAGPAAKLAITKLPAQANADQGFEVIVEVQDYNGNVKTSDNATKVTLQVEGDCCPPPYLTVWNGTAKFWVNARKAGAAILTATAEGLSAATAKVNVVPGAPARLADIRIDAQPPHYGPFYLSADGNHTVTVAVSVQDQWGNLATGPVPVTFKTLAQPRAFTGLGAAGTTVTAVDGVARLPIRAGTVATETPDVIQVEGRRPDGMPLLGSMDPAVSQEIRAWTVGAASRVKLMAPATITAGEPTEIRVRILDDQDRFVSTDSGRTVTLQLADTALTAQTSGGEAVFTVAPEVAMSYYLRATALFDGVKRSSEQWIHVQAGPPVRIGVRVSFREVETGTVIPHGVGIGAKDRFGNDLPSETISDFTYAINGSTNTGPWLSGASGSVTFTAGNAAGTLVIGDVDGKASVLYRGQLYTEIPVETNTIQVKLAGIAHHLTLIESKKEIAVDYGGYVRVGIADAMGTLKTADNTTYVALRSLATEGLPSLPETGATVSNGVAHITIPGTVVAGTYRFEATAPGLPSLAISVTFNPDPPAKVETAPVTLDSDGTSTAALTFRIADRFGNTVTTYSGTMTFAIVEGEGLATLLTTSAPIVQGKASVQIRAGMFPGTVRVMPSVADAPQLETNAATITLVSPPGKGRIVVTLKDLSTGMPAAGVTFSLSDMNGQAVSSGRTGSDGTFDVGWVSARRYLIQSGLPLSGTMQEHPFITVTENGTMNMLLWVISDPDKTTLSGTVRSVPDNADVPGATIRVFAQEGALLRTVQTSGRYDLGGLTMGTYVLEASADGYVTDRRTVTLQPGMPGWVDFRLAAPPNVGTVYGTVTDAETGAVLSGVQIIPAQWDKTVLTGAAGTYSLQQPSDGYGSQLTAFKPGYALAHATANFPAGALETINFALTPMRGTLQGTVLDEFTRQPVAGATVRVVINQNQVFGTATTNANGVFTVPNLAGTFWVHVSANGYPNGSSPMIEVGAEGVTTATVTVHPPAVTGTVSDSRGRRVPGATILAINAMGNPMQAATTDSAGTYRLNHLYNYPDPLTIRAFASGYDLAETQVTVALEPKVVNLTLPSTEPFGDLNDDGAIDLADLAMLIAQYRKPAPAEHPEWDLNGNGQIDLADLAALTRNIQAAP